MSAPDAYSPEWTVYWTLLRELRPFFKGKNAHLANTAAEQVVKNLRMSNWHLIKGMRGGGHGSSREAIQMMVARRKAFEDKLRELEEMSDDSPADWRQGKLDV